MATFDLDAARAARAEKRGPNPTITVDSREWEMAPELPMEVLELVDKGNVRAAFDRLVIGPVDDDGEDAPAFPSGSLTVQDVAALVEEVYKVDPTG